MTFLLYEIGEDGDLLYHPLHRQRFGADEIATVVIDVTLLVPQPFGRLRAGSLTIVSKDQRADLQQVVEDQGVTIRVNLGAIYPDQHQAIKGHLRTGDRGPNRQ